MSCLRLLFFEICVSLRIMSPRFYPLPQMLLTRDRSCDREPYSEYFVTPILVLSSKHPRHQKQYVSCRVYESPVFRSVTVRKSFSTGYPPRVGIVQDDLTSDPPSECKISIPTVTRKASNLNHGLPCRCHPSTFAATRVGVPMG